MGLIDYQEFVRANSEYLLSSSESEFDIRFDLTIACWVWFDAESTDVVTGIVSKWYETGNQRAFAVYKDASNKLIFAISSDGTTITSIHDFGVNYVEGEWIYVAGKYTPTEELALFVNGMWYRNTVGIPGSISNSSEPLAVARMNRSNYLDGRISHLAICAYAVPDNFVCAMYGHGKALATGIFDSAYPCSSSTSSSSSTTSSSSSSHAP